jgi:MFS family permease
VATTEPTATGPTPAPTGRGGLAEVLQNEAFRRLWVANVMAAVAMGTSRFAFVWLIGDLTAWNPAVAILGVFMGLPAMLLSAQAGALADRLPPRRLGLTLLWSTSAAFVVTALLIPTSLMTVPLAMACAFVSSIPIAGTTPLFQALVPVVVPRERLLPAIALQNMGMMSALILGAFLGGGIIALTNVAGGFWALAAAAALGAVVYGRIALPEQAPGAGTDRRGAVREGIRVAWHTEPLRSLLAVSFVVGLAIAATMLLLPAVARDILGTDSFGAGLLNAAMGAGLMVTSLLVASRPAPARPGRLMMVLMGTTLPGGLILIGWSTSYAVTLVVVLLWGAGGGINMALLRTALQQHTPSELMGRMMGLSALAQQGAFPIGSVLLFVLVRLAGLGPALVIAGVLIALAVWALSVPPHLRRL